MISESVERGRSDQTHSSSILTLLDARIASCRATLSELRLALSELSPELLEMHEKLVSISRSLSGCASRSKVCSLSLVAMLEDLGNNSLVQFPVAEVQKYRKQLKEIQQDFEGGKQPEDISVEMTPDERLHAYATKIKRMSYSERGTVRGRELVGVLIERCFLWSDIIMQRLDFRARRPSGRTPLTL